MLRCVVLYNDSTNCNVTLLRDDNVIVNCMGDFSLDTFLQNTGVDCLQVIYKPSIPRSVPENGFKIGSITLNDLIKPCVISSEEIKRLADYSSLYGVNNIMIYNYIDLIVDRYKTEDRVIVLSEWVADYVVIAFIELGNLVEFRRIKESKLTSALAQMRKRFNCNHVVQFNNSFDFANCYSSIHNMKLVEKDKQIFLSHIPYVIENAGISLFENPSVVSILDSATSTEEDDVEESIYTKEEDNDSNYTVDTDIDDVDSKPIVETPVKVGFWARLFGKKNKDDVKSKEKSRDKKRKEKGFNFDDYSEVVDEDDDETFFSQVANGSSNKASYNSLGANPGMKRKFTFFDYVFYTAFVIFFTCSVVVGGLQLVYKEKLKVLAGEYDSAIKIKNQLQTNVSIADDSSRSPATKITQLSGLNLPSSFNIRNVDYDGYQYKVNIEIAHDDNIDSIKNYLPSDLVISSVNPLSTGDEDAKSKKIYEVVLLVS